MRGWLLVMGALFAGCDELNKQEQNPMTAPIYAGRNCTDHFAEDAYSTWTNCTGTRMWASGDVYEGDFKDGKQHGKGKYTLASGDVYEGDFKDGKQHGKGKYSSADGTTYEGIWVDGEYSESLTTE